MKRILAALLGLLLFASLASADTLFPNTPTTGQIYNFNNTGVLYQWDGAKWVTTGTTSPAITKQIFTSSGTYTPSSGMQYAIIECVGGGGGGGGQPNSTDVGASGGGGGGAYSRVYVTAGTVGASQTVTIGAAGTAGVGATPTAGGNGGDTSVGTLCVAKGGTGGGAGVTNQVTADNGGAGGSAASGTGDLKISGGGGNAGGNGSLTSTAIVGLNPSGGNAGGGFGFGGNSQRANGTGGPTGYGGGGSGASSYSSGGAQNGAAGTAGIVVITEFLASSWGGPLPQVVLPGGRLTTASATPVPTTDQTAITTIYYTPYKSTFTPLWNGTQFTPVYTGELSAAMGSNWAANSNYDWFEYNDAGTLRLCSGPAWTSDTARGTGAGTTQLTLTQGILVNTVSMTCRYSNAATVTVAAGYGTYLGTMRTTGSTGTTEDSKAKRFIWNMYNRVARPMQIFEATSSWTYNTGTWRQVNGATANQLAFVRGLDEDAATVTEQYTWQATNTDQHFCGIGLDSTTTPTVWTKMQENVASALIENTVTYYGLPGLGYHYLSWMEKGDGTANTQTAFGSDGGQQQNGINGSVMQ